ncbi:CaiB/BaiF CoA transferase family protein [Candidatus Marimicrobium litorale]|uniref:CoA transferase n=1 Tax=Candidatus Marimicrobium litorale TaxID=2518991 RepID=A0ABT3T5W3_9GAMM|nr:CoA transferase [Candidatus Marimicrobium litorale]MCX2977206.1 CoA transferase [Candidatus Marimicrobium litorale]
MDVKLSQSPTGPLKGIRVIDITSMITGPLCSQQLGDLGADVVKIEPLHGEVARWMTPPQKAGLSGFYSQMNRNKRSLSIDMKNPTGIEIIRELVQDADILVENFRSGVLERLGIGYEDLRKLNERLVFVSITGFGPTGPYAHKPAYDPIAQGLVGMMHIQGMPFGGKPQLIQSAIVDKTTATTAAGVAMAALYARDCQGGTGKGQRVDVPMIDAWAINSLPDMIPVDSFVPNDMQDPAPLAVLRTFETADGYVVGMALQDNHFEGLCNALECTELLDREGMRNVGERVNDFGPWLDAIGAVMKSFTTDDLLSRLDEAGVPFGPVKTIREFVEDPQAKHNRTIFDADHPEAGTMRYVRYPGHLSDTPAGLYRHPPRLGEHSAEVLREVGYSDEEIERLLGNGVIGAY